MKKNENRPLVSAVMSTYNDSKFLLQAIKSILDQTYNNLELIVINDASTDDTTNILKQINDDRIRVINNKENLKLARNLNHAICLAKGKYIARMDADDISEKNRIERQVEYLEKNNAVDVLGTYAKKFGDESGVVEYPVNHEEIKVKLLFENVLCHPSIIFRAKSIDFKYDEQCSAGQDYELWSRIIWEKKFAVLPETLINYRIHPNQTRKKNGTRQKVGAIKARKNMACHLVESINEEDDDIQIKMNDFNIIKSALELHKIELYLQELLKENQTKQVFSHKLLEVECGKIYYFNWYISVGLNGISIKTIKKSEFKWFFDRLRIKDKAKILYRVWYNKLEGYDHNRS